MARVSPCIDCPGVNEGCESPCLIVNAQFEQYLVASYCQAVEKSPLIAASAYKGLCKSLYGNLSRLTHYARPLIQPERLQKAQPPVTADWPQWVIDRARVYLARKKRRPLS